MTGREGAVDGTTIRSGTEQRQRRGQSALDLVAAELDLPELASIAKKRLRIGRHGEPYG